jgi:hypothetical protein
MFKTMSWHFFFKTLKKTKLSFLYNTDTFPFYSQLELPIIDTPFTI